MAYTPTRERSSGMEPSQRWHSVAQVDSHLVMSESAAHLRQKKRQFMYAKSSAEGPFSYHPQIVTHAILCGANLFLPVNTYRRPYCIYSQTAVNSLLSIALNE